MRSDLAPSCLRFWQANSLVFTQSRRAFFFEAQRCQERPSALRELEGVALFILHSSLFILHSSFFTLHSSLFTLHSSLFTLHFPDSKSQKGDSLCSLWLKNSAALHELNRFYADSCGCFLSHISFSTLNIDLFVHEKHRRARSFKGTKCRLRR